MHKLNDTVNSLDRQLREAHKVVQAERNTTIRLNATAEDLDRQLHEMRGMLQTEKDTVTNINYDVKKMVQHLDRLIGEKRCLEIELKAVLNEREWYQHAKEEREQQDGMEVSSATIRTYHFLSYAASCRSTEDSYSWSEKASRGGNRGRPLR